MFQGHTLAVFSESIQWRCNTLRRNEQALCHRTTWQQDRAGQGRHQVPQPLLFSYKLKKERERNCFSDEK